MIEQWEKVDGFEYEISNQGNIRSLSRTVVCRYGKNRIHKGKALKPQLIKGTGYLQANLCRQGTQISRSIHRLVAIAFIPNPLNLCDVNHKNGIKIDNRVDNLEWVTRSENILHSYANGLQVSLKGIDHPSVKLDTVGVTVIRETCHTRLFSQRRIAEYFKISQQNVSDIYNNKRWKIS